MSATPRRERQSPGKNQRAVHKQKVHEETRNGGAPTSTNDILGCGGGALIEYANKEEFGWSLMHRRSPVSISWCLYPEVSYHVLVMAPAPPGPAGDSGVLWGSRNARLACSGVQLRCNARNRSCEMVFQLIVLCLASCLCLGAPLLIMLLGPLCPELSAIHCLVSFLMLELNTTNHTTHVE